METRYGRPVYEKNPFLEGLGSRIITRTRRESSDLSLEDNNGESITGTSTTEKESVSLSYLQVTDDWISCMLDFISNGNVAAWIMIFFMYEIKHSAISKDFVFLPYKRIIEIAKVFDKPHPSRPTFSRGTSRMYDNRVIANHFYGIGWYWFNPSMVFNGNIKGVVERSRHEQGI